MGTFSLEPWYITGWVEGEGSFTYSRQPSINLYFSVRTIVPLEGDDRLEALQEYFGGIGRLYDTGRRPRDGARRRMLRITRGDELPEVVAHFDDYPLVGPKREAYAIWREMVEIKTRVYRRPDRERLEELARALSSASSRAR